MTIAIEAQTGAGPAVIDNVEISGEFDGIRLAPDHSIIHSCYIEVDELGIDVEGSFCRIFSTAVIAADAAIDVTAAGEDLWVAGCYLSSFDDTVRAANHNNIRIVENLIDAGINGIDLTTCASPVIAENIISFSGAHGIILTDCDEGLLAENRLSSNGGTTTNTFDGIILAGDSDRNYLTGNKIVPRTAGNTTRYGINVSAVTCNNNIYVGNWAGPTANFGIGPYNDAGTGTLNTWPGAAAPVGDNYTL